MTISELIIKLCKVASKNNRITVRVEHEDVFAYYDLEFVEYDPVLNEFYITTEDTRGVNQRYADDSDSNTQPFRAIKAVVNPISTNHN